jgi:hypothetical protein
MKLRTLPLVVTAAAAVLVPTLGWTPAFADPPAAPGLTVDFSVAGTVSGTVSSADQPHVLVALVAASDSGEPVRTDVTLADTTSYSFPSWGYGALTTVQAWACPTATYDALTCSAATVSDPFTPTDVAISPTFSSDATVGPLGQVTLDLGDPGDTGGGTLLGRWTDDNPAPQGAAFAVPKTGPTVVPIRDGVGTVHLYRCDNAQGDHCVEEATSGSYTVKQNATASIGAVTGVSDVSPTTTFTVTTNGAGTGGGGYSLSWHLEKSGVPVDGYGANGVTGTLTGGAAQDVPLAATGLPKGTYAIVGTITVTDTDYGTYTDIAMTGGTLHSAGDTTAPAVNAIKLSRTKIYPRIADSHFPGTTTIDVTGAGVPEISSLGLYAKSTGKLTRTLKLTVLNSVHGRTTWDGRTYAGSLVPAGTYVIKARDAAGNMSPTTAEVTVSGYRLIAKIWSKTFTPVGSLSGSYVAKCSTLRTPSLRGWYKSLGYYANTRCGSQTTADSLIQTAHAAILPSAAEYTSIRVSTYGGAARAKPGSKIRIRYLNTKGDWTNTRTLSSTLGTHNGATASPSGLIFSDHSFGWGLYTGFGYQYDVKSFTIVLHYKVLGS